MGGHFFCHWELAFELGFAECGFIGQGKENEGKKEKKKKQRMAEDKEEIKKIDGKEPVDKGRGGGGGGGGGEELRPLKPWEQHSAVISIPRFDYNAPASLLHRSHTGFLVTSPIKREKSATKEAMAIFTKYFGSLNSSHSESIESSEKNISTKRRKLCLEEKDWDCLNGAKIENAADNSGNVGKLSKESCLSPAKSDATNERSDVLSLVKLTRSGLLLFTFPKDTTLEVVAAVSDIIQSAESGSLSSPLWCRRIFPIQATCSLDEKELQTVVSQLVVQFVNDERNKLARPIKFAVGYNRRGFEDAEMKDVASTNSHAVALLDRNKCFSVVAEAVKNSVSDSIVDLQFPELSILVELLPLSGLPKGSLVVGISVLPHHLVNTKPRLCIKALVSDTKTINGRKNK